MFTGATLTVLWLSVHGPTAQCTLRTSTTTKIQNNIARFVFRGIKEDKEKGEGGEGIGEKERGGGGREKDREKGRARVRMREREGRRERERKE